MFFGFLRIFYAQKIYLGGWGLSTPPWFQVISEQCRKHASLNIELTWLDIAEVFCTRLDIRMMQGRKKMLSGHGVSQPHPRFKVSPDSAKTLHCT